MAYDITDNNTTHWDWLLWETEGNSDPKYQRGGRERRLGLYRLNYDLLRKAGNGQWAAPHADGTVGGGFVKIALLDRVDYSGHLELMATFFPNFEIKDGKLLEPAERPSQPRAGNVARSSPANTSKNTLVTDAPVIVMPFNYDDNSAKSKVLGREPREMADVEAEILKSELPRWATASRSTIAAFGPIMPNVLLEKHEINPKKWNLRPGTVDDGTLKQVTGDPTASKFLDYQRNTANKNKRYYSVKTGVDFVATQNQGVNGKDKLEGNSIHAMSRSNLMAGMIEKVGRARFEAEYQIEILSILLGGGNSWDGIQIREIGQAGKDEVWFPALAIPTHGKAFAQAWQKGCEWDEFWSLNFAKPLGRAKAEMMAYFGMQHMTSNAQNFLIAFGRGSPGTKAKHVILRDIGDTILHTEFFNVLKTVDKDLFGSTWDHEIADAANGIVLAPGSTSIGGGYSNPQITRIGTGIVFFYPVFMKGDVDSKKAGTSKILAKWGLSHNDGFLDYMREKLGYSESWDSGTAAGDTIKGVADNIARCTADTAAKAAVADQKAQQAAANDPEDDDAKIFARSTADLKTKAEEAAKRAKDIKDGQDGDQTAYAALLTSLKSDADLSLSGKSPSYAMLAANIMGVSAAVRQKMIIELRLEVERALLNEPQSEAELERRVTTVQNLVAGHEMAICAEIHAYIQSDAGKKALVHLHEHGAAAPVAPRVSEKCSKCSVSLASNAARRNCSECGAKFCPACVKGLRFPPGTLKSMEPLETTRVCGVNGCRGFVFEG